MIPEIAKVVGQVGQGWWAQIHDFIPQDQEKLVARGRLVLAVGCRGDDSLDTGREILTRCHELYYGQTESSCLEQLKLVGQTVQAEFPQAEVVGLAIKDRVLYLLSVGGGIWVRTADKEGWLVAVETPPAEPNPVHTFSGPMASGQEVVLGNHLFWQLFPTGMLRAALENADLTAAVETLTAAAHGGERGLGVVGILLRHPNTTTEAKPEKPQPSPVRPRIFIPSVNRQIWVRATRWFGIGFLVILLALSGWGLWQRRQQQIKASQLNILLTQAQSAFTEAQALENLNVVRSRELMAQVRQGLEAAKNLKGASKDPRFQQLTEQLPAVSDRIQGIHRPSVTEVVDLALVREDIQATRLAALEQNQLVILDGPKGRLVQVDPETGSGKVTFGSLPGGRLLATYPGKIVVWTGDEALVCLVKAGQCASKIKPAEGWLDMAMFAGNLYVLRADGLYKYQSAGDGFGRAQKWNNQDLTAGEQASMAIDGNIWVLDQGSLVKFNRGNRQEFALASDMGTIGNRARLVTREEVDKLVILDGEHQRLVVFDKAGQYQGQYLADVLGQATGVVLDQAGKTMYLLAGAKIYSLAL